MKIIIRVHNMTILIIIFHRFILSSIVVSYTTRQRFLIYVSQLPVIFAIWRCIFENFLLHDSGHGVHRIKIFYRLQNLNILSVFKLVWFVDGTFKVALHLSSKVYVILCKYFDSVHPLIYALLLDKKIKLIQRTV